MLRLCLSIYAIRLKKKRKKDIMHMFHDVCLRVHPAYTLGINHDNYDDHVVICHATLCLCHDYAMISMFVLMIRMMIMYDML